MATTTPNLGLTLPIGSEKVSRQIINGNFSLIDTAYGTLNSKVTGLFAIQAVTPQAITANVWIDDIFGIPSVKGSRQTFVINNITVGTIGYIQKDQYGQIRTTIAISQGDSISVNGVATAD